MYQDLSDVEWFPPRPKSLRHRRPARPPRAIPGGGRPAPSTSWPAAVLYALAIGWAQALRPVELRTWVYLAGGADPVTSETDAGSRAIQRFLRNDLPAGARAARARLIKRGLLEVVEQPIGPWPMRVRVIIPTWPPPAEPPPAPRPTRAVGDVGEIISPTSFAKDATALPAPSSPARPEPMPAAIAGRAAAAPRVRAKARSTPPADEPVLAEPEPLSGTLWELLAKAKEER